MTHTNIQIYLKFLAIRMEEKSRFNSINSIIGIIIISLSIIVLIFANVVVLSLMIVLSIAVIFSGIGRIYNAFYNTLLNNFGKILKLVTGVIAVLVGVLVLILTLTVPSVSIILLISLIGYTFIIIGMARIFMGILMDSYKKEYRIFLVMIGLITMIFAFIVVLFPALGYFVLITYLSLTLMINGLTRIVFSLFGKK